MAEIFELGLGEKEANAPIQMTLVNRGRDDQEKAHAEVMAASRLLLNDAMMIMKKPYEARHAIEKAQVAILNAMAILIAPDAPAWAWPISQLGAINLKLENALYCLDPEGTKTIEDALSELGSAMKKLRAVDKRIRPSAKG